MHQFYIEDINNIELSEGQKHQLNKVLRMHVNEEIRLVDANGEGVVASIQDSRFENFNIESKINFKSKKRKLKIIASLIRNERLEWMIQKAAEAGVDEIVLYTADHGVVKSYGNKTDRKLERFNLIALEASEQSQRQYPLQVLRIVGKEEIKNELKTSNYIADTSEHPHYVDLIQDKEDICVIIGPEGGFSENERVLFHDLGFIPTSLGDNIYRAETAPLAVAVLTHIR